MARRSVLLTLAVGIALLGTLLIVMYVQSIDARAKEGQQLVEVLTATEAIELGESVSDAQEAGKIERKQVRRDDMVEGALSSTSSISTLVATSPIYPGEQLLAKKFGSLGDADSLVIRDKRIAVSVELTDSERVAGFVNPGAEVAVFSTVTNAVRMTPDGSETRLPPSTRLILARVPVLGVGTTSLTATTTTADDGSQVTEEVPRTILTLGLNQKEAEKLIHADRTSDLTFALLNDTSSIKDQSGVQSRDLYPELYQGAP